MKRRFTLFFCFCKFCQKTSTVVFGANWETPGSPARGWPYRFLLRRTTGSSKWTMMLAICASVHVSKYLDIPTLDFYWKKNVETSSILTWVWADTATAASPDHPGSIEKCAWLLRPSFEMLMFLVQWTLHTILNHLCQCHLGERPCLSTFDTEVPAPNSQDDRDPSMTQNELFCPYSLLLRSLPSCFWLASAAMLGFSSVFPILSPLPPLHLKF